MKPSHAYPNKVTPKIALIIQTLLEGLLPVLGYFYWNWDASFIFLFFLIDWLLHWTLSYLKAKKSINTITLQANERKQTYTQLLIGVIGIVVSCVLAFLLMHQLNPSFSITERLWAFLSYSDMGVPQGVVLIPLMVLVGIMEYKQKFIRLQLFAKFPAFAFSLATKKQGIVASSVLLLACILAQFIQLSDTLVLFGSVIIVLVYRLMNRNELGI